MINRNSLCIFASQNEASIEYEFTEKWLESTIESRLIDCAKQGKNELAFNIHVSEANPSMIRKVLNDKGYGVLTWPYPSDAKPPFTSFTIKILW